VSCVFVVGFCAGGAPEVLFVVMRVLMRELVYWLFLVGGLDSLFFAFCCVVCCRLRC